MENLGFSVLLYINKILPETIQTLNSIFHQILPEYIKYELIILEETGFYTGNLTSEYDNLLNNVKQNVTINRINCPNVGEANAYNHGTIKAQSNIVMYVRNGDILKPTRFMDDYVFMFSNNLISIKLSDYALQNQEGIEEVRFENNTILFEDLVPENQYQLGTMTINKEGFLDFDYFFEPYWQGSYLNMFLLRCFLYHKTSYIIHNICTTILKNPSPEISNDLNNKQEFINNIFNRSKPKNNSLTIIIPFKDEGSEIERTVVSIKATTTNEINILLIDDASKETPSMYYDVACRYGCLYHKNKDNLGVAGSRDHGIFDLMPTEFFMLLDGHMRFYDIGWDEKIIPLIESHPNDIICSSTIEMTKDNQWYYNEDGKKKIRGTFGAYLNKYPPHWDCTWQNKDLYSEETMFEIPVVLGACYMSSRTHWHKIGGLRFLKKYGLDEQLMSIKNFMYGGKNLYLMDFHVGHFYKVNEGQNKLGPVSNEIKYNRLLMTTLFNPSYLEEHKNSIRQEDPNNGEKIINMLNQSYNQIVNYRNRMNKEVVRSFDEYIKFNESIRYYQNNKKVFVIGCWEGADVEYYINRGYTVIALEANGICYSNMRKKFKTAIKRGNLILLNKCAYNTDEPLVKFYYEPNCPNWSSTQLNVVRRAIKDNNDFIEVNMPAIKLQDLIKQYGMPDLLRISIAGDEVNVLDSIDINNLPHYLTIESEFLGENPKKENEEYEVLDKLYSMGYNKFRIFTNQNWYDFETLVDNNKYPWKTYEEMKKYIEEDRKKFFLNNPNLPHYCYYTNLHCSY